MQTPAARATLIGLIAIILWSTSVGLFRSIAEHFGPVGGPALVYTLSAVCLWIAQGRPSLKDLPPRYLVVGGLLFVAYEMCLALAIGFAHNRSQSLELGMINYLWPSLTVLFALWLNNQRSTWLIWPGLLLAIGGVAQVMKGNGDWSPVMMWRNILDNPLAYALAFAAAITWALYCNLTRRWGNGKSGVTLFFCATALALWFHYAFSSDAAFTFTLPGTLQLGFMGLSTAVAYSAWNHGISHGNMTLLATASYFTPVSSALLASLWLGLTPGISFWQGVAMVVAGSLLCWLATRR